MADDDTVVEDTAKNTEDVKPVSAVPAPVDPNPKPPKDDLRDLVENLSAKVDDLAGQLAAVVETGGERDSVPGGSKPWTAKRIF